MDDLKFNFDTSAKEPESRKSPLESLRERMLSQEHDTEPDKEDSATGFSVFKEENEADDGFTLSSPDYEDETDETVSEEEETEEIQEEEPEKRKPSFLKRMRRYTTDDNGVDVTENEEPLYELDSVNSILGIESEEEDESEESFYEEDEEPKDERSDGTIPFISDIDRTDSIPDVPDKPATSDTATIRFTPVTDLSGNKPSVSVDTMTHRIDLGDEITDVSADEEETEREFGSNEFDSFEPKEEITDRKSEKRFARLFAIKKRNRFLKTAASGILTFVLFIFLLPPVTNSMLEGSKGLMITSAVIFGIIVLINADMFLSLARINSDGLDNDISASLATVSTLLFTVFSIMQDDFSFPLVFICAFTLFIRSMMSYYNAANYCDNLRVISVPRPKKAITLISDTSTAVALAKNSIEGNILIATSRQTDRVADFMKYSEYGKKLYGKIKMITSLSLVLAVICGVVTGLIKGSVVEAFYASSVILLLTAMPIVFFIDSLPLRSMTSRLNRKGAMLTGFAAAEQLNTANAVVVRISDLFPSGTVVLKDMKILSDNNVDDILMRAASVTDALSSPLSNIFKRIAKSNDAYDIPDSDTVQYEERLGITGWVNNERLFIGNRTLLEAHGIEVPSVELDHSILERGYFPVYVANDNKACVLLVIKYTVDPEIARQLHEAESLGITVLIDNSDPNINNDLIKDYFGIDPSYIYVMTSAGSKTHRTATPPTEEYSSGAAFKGNSLSLLNILSSASKLKKSNIILTVIYCLAAVLGIVYFVYSSFLTDSALIERAMSVLIYEIAATAISLAAFLIKRP